MVAEAEAVAVAGHASTRSLGNTGRKRRDDEERSPKIERHSESEARQVAADSAAAAGKGRLAVGDRMWEKPAADGDKGRVAADWHREPAAARSPAAGDG